MIAILVVQLACGQATEMFSFETCNTLFAKYFHWSADSQNVNEN